MKRMVMIIVCFFAAMACIDAGEFDKATLEKLVAQLGDDSFRVRRKAQKSILSEMGALQKTFLDMLAKTEGEPTNELKALTTKLKSLSTSLEAVDAKSDDPEVTMRLKKIMDQTYPSLVYNQKLGVQKMIVAEFKNTGLEQQSDGDKIAKVHIYAKKGTGVMEIADLRVIRMGYDMSGHYDTDKRLPIEYSGSWSSSGGNFSFNTDNGQSKCKWKGWEFTVNPDGLAIGGKRIPIGKGKNIVIIDNAGSLKCHMALSH